MWYGVGYGLDGLRALTTARPLLSCVLGHHDERWAGRLKDASDDRVELFFSTPYGWREWKDTFCLEIAWSA